MINERVKEVRKANNLNQKEFGDKVGLKQSAVSSMEQPGGSVNDRNIRLICDAFNVNEDWLRTGKGDMYEESNDMLLKQLATQYKLEGPTIDLIRNFLMLTAEQRAAILPLFHGARGLCQQLVHRQCHHFRGEKEQIRRHRRHR